MITVPASLPGKNTRFEETQTRWLEETVLMCLAKERVVGIYYSNWNQQTATGPQTALVDSEESPRESLDLLQSMSNKYWC
jgi:hypothetical protein